MYPEQVKVDINPYLIKYDYDIAAALSTEPKLPKSHADIKNKKRFSILAYKELLVELS